MPVNPPGAVFYHLGPPGAPEATVPPPQRQLQPPQLHLQVSALHKSWTAQVWCWGAEMSSQRMTPPAEPSQAVLWFPLSHQIPTLVEENFSSCGKASHNVWAGITTLRLTYKSLRIKTRCSFPGQKPCVPKLPPSLGGFSLVGDLMRGFPSFLICF